MLWLKAEAATHVRTKRRSADHHFPSPPPVHPVAHSSCTSAATQLSHQHFSLPQKHGWKAESRSGRTRRLRPASDLNHVNHAVLRTAASPADSTQSCGRFLPFHRVRGKLAITRSRGRARGNRGRKNKERVGMKTLKDCFESPKRLLPRFSGAEISARLWRETRTGGPAVHSPSRGNLHSLPSPPAPAPPAGASMGNQHPEQSCCDGSKQICHLAGWPWSWLYVVMSLSLFSLFSHQNTEQLQLPKHSHLRNPSASTWKCSFPPILLLFPMNFDPGGKKFWFSTVILMIHADYSIIYCTFKTFNHFFLSNAQF